MFLKNWGELAGRWDPIYYQAVNNLYIVNNTRYDVKKLGEVVNMQRGRFGHRPRNDPDYYGGDYPFIQTGNIVEASKSNKRIEYTQTLNDLGLSTSRLFNPDVLVITIAANIGDTAILDYKACFPDSLVALIPKTNINIYYLNYYLRLIKDYIENLAPQSAQKNINLQQLAQIPVIVPQITVQNNIVNIMNAAYAQKQAKEKETLELHARINDYLLTELGIVMPEQEANNLTNRIFYCKSSDLIGNRFDPKYYGYSASKFKNPDSRFENVPLNSLIIEVKTGMPIRKDYRETDGQYPYYGANGIIGYMNDFTHDGEYLIMGQDGYIGNHYIVTGRFWASNHNWVIKLDKSKCNYYYIKYFLDFWDYSHLITGAVIPKLTRLSLGKILIPLPPIQMQNEISLHIKTIEQRTQMLKEQVSDIIHEAKKLVSSTLLGGEINEA